MKVDGACHCGHITFEANIDPARVGICHCTDCQTMSGSAFRVTVQVSDADFKFLSGTPKVYVKTAETGNKREQHFCPECGTHIYATNVGDGPKLLGIRVATLRQREDLSPSRQIWCRSAQPWVNDLASVPAHDMAP